MYRSSIKDQVLIKHQLLRNNLNIKVYVLSRVYTYLYNDSLYIIS